MRPISRQFCIAMGLLAASLVLLALGGQVNCHDGHDDEPAAAASAAPSTEATPADGAHDHHDHHEHHGTEVHLEEHKNNEQLRGHKKQSAGQPPHKALNYYLEWVEEPEIVHGFGERKLITQCITTGEKPSETQVSTNFLHTFEVESSGFERYLDEFVQKALQDVSGKFNLTRKTGQRSQLKQKFMFDKRSKAVVMFRDQVIKLEGKVRKVYNDSCSKQLQQLGQITRQQANCAKVQKHKKSNEFDLSIRATEVDEKARAKGAFSIEYFGLDKFRHPQFYNLENRHIELEEPLPENSEDIRSPFHCAELAMNASKLIAVYDVVHMSCSFGEPAVPSRISGKMPTVFSLDKTGKPVGNYTFSSSDEEEETGVQTLDRTDSRAAVDKWAADKKCDLINSINGLYTCLKFEEKPASVVMFRRAEGKPK